jgi:hypothetical protein
VTWRFIDASTFELPGDLCRLASWYTLAQYPIQSKEKSIGSIVALPRKARGNAMVKKIALEEHFLDPGLVDNWRPTMVDVAPQKTA